MTGITSKRFCLVFLMLLTAAVGICRAQSNVAPTKWERYTIPNQGATILMPKLPVVVKAEDNCGGEKSAIYGAYSEDTAYILKIVNAVEPDTLCRSTRIRRFSANNFSQRLEAFRRRDKDTEESEIEKDGRKVKRFQSKIVITLLFNDYENRRWFELSAFGYELDKEVVKKFLFSLSLDQTIKGRAIGEGAWAVLGDDLPEGPVVSAEKSDGKNDDSKEREAGKSKSNTAAGAKTDSHRPLLVAFTPLPSLTETARKLGIAGKVRLKITFASNGRISDIYVESGLKYGLTEQAIEAAKKLIFVPAKKDNAFISVTKNLEYRFNLD